MSNYKKKTDQELLLGYLRQQEAQEQYNSMSPKERRKADKTQRASARSARLDKARERQRAADERTYGKDSQFLIGIQPSAGEDSRGGIWDLSTDSYEPVDGNQNGINDRINDSGIDRIASYDTNREEADGQSGDEVGHPFQLVGAGNKLYLRKGTVNNVVPTYDGTELEDDYTENELTLPGSSSTQQYWLKAVSTGDLDNEGITTLTVEDSAPSDDTAAQARQYIGAVTTNSDGDVDGTPSNLSGSQNLDSCGANHSWNVI